MSAGTASAIPTGSSEREDAATLIVAEAGGQFDPDVVEAFLERELAMRALQREFASLAALN